MASKINRDTSLPPTGDGPTKGAKVKADVLFITFLIPIILGIFVTFLYRPRLLPFTQLLGSF